MSVVYLYRDLMNGSVRSIQYSCKLPPSETSTVGDQQPHKITSPSQKFALGFQISERPYDFTMAQTGPERRRPKFAVFEDVQLRQLVAEYGVENWRHIASLMPGRNPRQCRERWKHYLSGTGIPVPWTVHEDQVLLERVQAWGPRWTRIANFFGNRTDLEVKARWIQKFNSVLPLPPRDFHVRAAPPPVPPPVKEPWKTEFAPIALPPQVQDWFAHLVRSEP
jgi:hypothetical protein